MAAEPELDAAEFRLRLMQWYTVEARVLPWRGVSDPYRIWVSEIMLQQTRVAAVVEHYNEFLRRFPTLLSLSLAQEPEVLAAWSGLGYYRRARMLHKAAKFIVLERDGRLPVSAAELRTLPGIGEYTSAAIASIAFGEAVAVVDGNVERVILRLVGRADEATSTARAFVRAQAQALVPRGERTGGAPIAPARRAVCDHSDVLRGGESNDFEDIAKPARKRLSRLGESGWSAEERLAMAAAAHPNEAAGGEDPAAKSEANPAGDHNQAMMELGAMVCLPRVPLCERCPVYELCRTRGEHVTQARTPQQSRPAAYLLDLRKQGTGTEVLLCLRPAKASIMPGMFELPPLPLEAVEGREPALRVRHSITNTNYYVQVFAPQRHMPEESGKRPRGRVPNLRGKVTNAAGELHWVNVQRLPGMPLTGLARKVLQRLKVMGTVRMNVLE